MHDDQLTLTEWAIKTGCTVGMHANRPDRWYAYARAGTKAWQQLYQLRDFVVQSVGAGVVWLCPRN